MTKWIMDIQKKKIQKYGGATSAIKKLCMIFERRYKR